MTRDPVCGARLDEEQVVYTSTYQGRRFYFCSPTCQQRFDQNPERHINRPES